MKRPRKSPDANQPRKSFRAPLVLGLILLILLFFVIQTQIHPSAAIGTAVLRVSLTPSLWITYTPSPAWTATWTATLTPRLDTKPTFTPSPALPPGKEPPACIFPLPQTTTAESTPENYTFSEPSVVLPIKRGEWPIQIIQWLPDSRRVLLVQDFDGTGNEDIEVFNPEADDLRVYARRDVRREPPAWLASLGALIYSNEMDVEFTGNRYRRQLWVTRGNPNNAQLLEDKTVVDMRDTYSIVVKPDGSEFAYRAPDGTQIFRRDASLKPLSPVTFDPAQWDYRGEIKRSLIAPIYVMAWRPGTSQIFIFSYPDYRPADSMGYTFLLDLDTGKLCELDFDGWASSLGLWSPNGRYLAIDRVQGSSRSADSTELTILDVTTGKLYPLDGTMGDFAWAPDNRHLLTVDRSVEESSPCSATGCEPIFRMHLIDFLSGEIDSVLPADQFATDRYGMLNSGTLMWSPDGSKVLALCEDGPDLCMISVQRTGQ